MRSQRSLIKTRNNRGPSTDPCKMPLDTDLKEEKIFLNFNRLRSAGQPGCNPVVWFTKNIVRFQLMKEFRMRDRIESLGKINV